MTCSRLKSGVSSVTPGGRTGAARVTRMARGRSVVIDLASFTLSPVAVVFVGASVGGGGYKPFTESAWPNNGLKYCTNVAYRRAEF